MEQENKRIQEFKQHLGINVDKPAQGAGTTNCGNTARRFFETPELVSQVIGVDKELISRFGVILTALNSGLEINPEKYKTNRGGESVLLERREERKKTLT